MDGDCMTKEENIATLNEHLEHWKRLLSEKICDQSEGEKTIDALQNAIKALEQEPCDDVISREDALQALCKAVHKNDDTIPCSNQRVSCLWDKTKVQDYAEEILRLPPVTPQPKMGRWKWNFHCSLCNNIGERYYDYCPGCGAKMQEVDE